MVFALMFAGVTPLTAADFIQRGDGDLLIAGAILPGDGGRFKQAVMNRLRDRGWVGKIVLFSSGGDVFGDGVNLASRIQGEAEPGTIVVSEAVFNNVRNKPGITLRDLGERRLKNVSDPVRLFALESA